MPCLVWVGQIDSNRHRYCFFPLLNAFVLCAQVVDGELDFVTTHKDVVNKRRAKIPCYKDVVNKVFNNSF
jgi:hypothetical protein